MSAMERAEKNGPQSDFSENGVTLLRDIGKTLTSTLDLDQVLRVIMDMIARLFEPKDWSLLMVDEKTDELYFAIVVGAASAKLKNLRLKIGEGIAGWVAQHGEPVIITEAYQDPRFANWVDKESGFKTESVLCVPLISKGRCLGVIELLNVAAKHQGKDSLDLLEALADFAAIAIENAKYVRKVRELTIVDDCTGLYNARHMNTLLETEISRAKRDNARFSVVFLDLDHFKDVNDKYGHMIGSRLLREIGQVLMNNIRTVDWAVRYGGDEFVIILPQAGREDAMLVTQRLRRALNSTVFFRREGLNLKSTASFGIATYPDCASTKEDIIKLADQAMYKVKDSSRDGICDACEIMPASGTKR